MENPSWPLTTARRKLGRLVKATAGGPQAITVGGVPVAVVVSQQDFERLRPKPQGRLTRN